MKHLCAIASALAVSAFASSALAKEPPRRSEPMWLAGITGISAGLTMVATSGIFAATQPCVTFPGLSSGCRPELENTYAAPLILVGGIVTVLSLPIFSIGFERDTGPLKVSSLELGPGTARVTW